jgi:dTMP kinase
MTPKRGRFVSLDGIDGTGKSTQCRLLVEWLREQSYDVVACVDPGGTPLGQELRQVLLSGRHHLVSSCEALLFMASRAQLVAEVIAPALDAGKLVVSDRYVLANIVYQGYGGGVDLDALRHVGRLSTQGIEPDLTILFNVSLDVALKRRGRPADRMESKGQEFFKRVHAGFLAEAKRSPERIVVVDATPGIEEVQAQVREVVRRVVP